jgi:hypothetical protein
VTTPNGQPSQLKPLQYRDFQPGDAAVQAGANKSEATVRGSNQDATATGQPDVASGLSALKGVANDQTGPPFTGQI